MNPILRKILRVSLLVGAAACAVIVLTHLGTFVLLAEKSIAFLFDKFERILKNKIGYFSAVVILGGLLVLLFKKLWESAGAGELYESGKALYRRGVERLHTHKSWTIFIWGLLIVFITWMFFAAAFPIAFVLAAALGIYFLLKFKDDKKKLYIIAAIIILLFFAPYFFLGEGVHVKIFDNLDSFVAKLKVLAESGKALSFDTRATVPNFLNGIHLSGFFSGFNVITWLFMIFGPFVGYTLNLLIMAAAAFGGMVLLLRNYVLQGEENNWVIVGVSLCFSLVPFYPPAGLSIAGIPLVLYAFLKIRERIIKIRYFVIILLFPFYSLLQHAGLFIIFCLGILFLVDLFKTRKFNLMFFLGLAVLCVGYVVSYFHMIYSFLNPEFVSYREEITPAAMSFAACAKETVHNFIFDRTNVISGHHVFVLLSAAIAIIAGISRKTKKMALLVGLISLALFNSALWGFKYWGATETLRNKFQLLNTLNLTRFFWLNPFIWYLIFAVSLWIISKIKRGKIIVSVLIVCQVLFLFTSYNWDYRHLLGRKTKLKYSLSYKEFYSEALFKEIETFINKPKKDYRVVSIGIHPAIAQYNGFYTLDIYTPIYPLAYKHRFQRIIEKELAKSPPLKRGFENNAKRCYILVSELHGKKSIRSLAFTRGITKEESQLKIKHLDLNTPALKEMGGEYIFSAVEILNYAENGLSFEKAFTRKDSPWKIYLYRVI